METNQSRADLSSSVNVRRERPASLMSSENVFDVHFAVEWIDSHRREELTFRPLSLELSSSVVLRWRHVDDVKLRCRILVYLGLFDLTCLRLSRSDRCSWLMAAVCRRG